MDLCKYLSEKLRIPLELCENLEGKHSSNCRFIQSFAGYLSMPANIVCLATTCGDHNCLHKYIHEHAQVPLCKI